MSEEKLLYWMQKKRKRGGIALSNVRELTQSSFDATISSGRVLVDFWAAWCAPCLMQSPVLEKLAAEIPHVTFAKVDVDKESSLARRFGIMSIPTLVLFHNGQVERTLIGYHGEALLKEALV